MANTQPAPSGITSDQDFWWHVHEACTDFLTAHANGSPRAGTPQQTQVALWFSELHDFVHVVELESEATFLPDCEGKPLRVVAEDLPLRVIIWDEP